jgi:hypothetical protein
MTAPRFDLYLTGELAPNQPRDLALQQLAALFKRPVDQVEKLLGGKANRIRKDLDSQQVQRYQQVFEKMGVISISKPSADTETTAKPNPVAASAQDLGLSPSGTPVLREDERQKGSVPAPNTDHLSLAHSDEDLGTSNEAPPLPTPDTDHLSLGAAGENLVQSKPPEPEIDIDELTADLSLRDVGTPVLDPKPEDHHKTPDTSHLHLK